MQSNTIRELIESNRTEKSWLDFKRDFYDFGDIEKKKDFLKDVLSMINTVRTDSAYIIFGVEQKEGKNVLYGIPNDYADDNVIASFIRDKFNFIPDIEWHFEEVDGKNIGVLEIPFQPLPFPIHLKKDNWGISKKDIYIRKGSSNKIADDQELAYLHQWLLSIGSRVGSRIKKPLKETTKIIIINQSKYVSEQRLKKGVIAYNKKYTNSVLSLISDQEYHLLKDSEDVSLDHLGEILMQQEHQLISDIYTMVIFIFDNKISGNLFFGFNSYAGYISTSNWQYIKDDVEFSITTYILNSIVFIILNGLLSDSELVQHHGFSGCIFDYCQNIRDKALVLEAGLICDLHQKELKENIENRDMEILENIKYFLNKTKEI